MREQERWGGQAIQLRRIEEKKSTLPSLTDREMFVEWWSLCGGGERGGEGRGGRVEKRLDGRMHRVDGPPSRGQMRNQIRENIQFTHRPVLPTGWQLICRKTRTVEWTSGREDSAAQLADIEEHDHPS
jgi:hypothetical protein